MVLYFDKNTRVYEADLNNLAVMNYQSVRDGCEVVERSPQIMGVRVEAGSVFFNSTVVNVSQQDVTISSSDPSYDRIDLIVINSSGVASVITGIPSAEPHTPDYDPLAYVVLARVFVDDLSTFIITSKIKDLRILRYELFAKYIETGIVSQTSVIVTHNLGDAEPMVMCYEGGTTLVIPQLITIDSSNQITVDFNPAFTGKIVIFGGTGGLPVGGGGTVTITVKEQDGVPTVYNVDELRVSDGTLTDNGGGAVSMDLSGTINSYKHTQSVTSSTWTVNHNLAEKFVQVIVYDSTDNWIQPNSITLIDANTLQIGFAIAIIGTAVIKK